MGIADIQAAFATTTGAAPAPAASAPLPVFQPQPAAAPTAPAQPVIVVSPGHRAITTAFGPAQIPDGMPLPPGCQYIDPGTGQPYPPLNPPGEAQALAPTTPAAAPQPASAAPQAVAPSPFVPTPQTAPTASPTTAVATAVSSAAAPAHAPVVMNAPPVATQTLVPTDRQGQAAPAVEVVLPADPAPKPRTRRRSGGASASQIADAAASGDLKSVDIPVEALSAFSTEDLRDELKRRGWQVALGDAQ